MADDHVLEIGPGPGVLTEALLATGCKVTAIEIDAGAVEHLRNVFSKDIANKDLILHHADALKLKWPSNVTKVVANIPYQISSPLIDLLTRFLRDQWKGCLVKVILLVQEEFAERMAMAIGPLDRGPLGLSLWLDFRPCLAPLWELLANFRTPRRPQDTL